MKYKVINSSFGKGSDPIYKGNSYEECEKWIISQTHHTSYSSVNSHLKIRYKNSDLDLVKDEI